MYEKAGLYSFISLNKQKRKQAIVLASLNNITTQLKEIEYQIEN